MKTQNPWMGRAKGSAGNMTASKVYDKNVLKAKAFEVNNPNTAAQQNQRTFFKEVSELTNQLSVAECRVLCPSAPKGMSRRNFISKQIAKKTKTVSGQKQFDVTLIKSLGNAKQAEIPTINSSLVEDDRVVHLEFNGPTDYTVEHADDCVLFVIMNQERKAIIFYFADTTFSDEIVEVPAPDTWAEDDTIQAFALNVGSVQGYETLEQLKVKERPIDD